MLWSRKSAPIHDKARHVGIDVTASRIRAVAVGMGKVQPLALDEPAEDLLLFIGLDQRLPEIGRAGFALTRKMPHAVVSNFLPALTQTREWRNGRHVFSPESALDLAFAKLHGPIESQAEAAALTLPAYLTPAQVGASSPRP